MFDVITIGTTINTVVPLLSNKLNFKNLSPKKNLKLSAVRLRRLSEFSRGDFPACRQAGSPSNWQSEMRYAPCPRLAGYYWGSD